jgi:hypothetical protein
MQYAAPSEMQVFSGGDTRSLGRERNLAGYQDTATTGGQPHSKQCASRQLKRRN